MTKEWSLRGLDETTNVIDGPYGLTIRQERGILLGQGSIGGKKGQDGVFEVGQVLNGDEGILEQSQKVTFTFVMF